VPAADHVEDDRFDIFQYDDGVWLEARLRLWVITFAGVSIRMIRMMDKPMLKWADMLIVRSTHEELRRWLQDVSRSRSDIDLAEQSAVE
jgi:hypothetical protein